MPQAPAPVDAQVAGRSGGAAGGPCDSRLANQPPVSGTRIEPQDDLLLGRARGGRCGAACHQQPGALEHDHQPEEDEQARGEDEVQQDETSQQGRGKPPVGERSVTFPFTEGEQEGRSAKLP